MKHLLIFDIDNFEEDYSVVMEGISFLEDQHIEAFEKFRKIHLNGKFYRVSMDNIQDIPRYHECPIVVPVQQNDGLDVLRLDEVWLRYYEMLRSERLDLNGNVCTPLDNLGTKIGNNSMQVVIPSVIQGRFKEPKRISINRFKEDIRECRVFYTIRIRVEREKIYNLQYLSLLLKNFLYLVREKRISVLLLDKKAIINYFPFCDPRDSEGKKQLNETHRFFSRYLRLLAKENTGTIYAPYYEDSEDKIPTVPIISPMDYKDASVGENFFPIIEIGREEYKTLFETTITKSDNLSAAIRREDLFRKDLTIQNRRALFQIGSNRFRNAADADPRNALLAFIAETAWVRLRRSWQDESGEVDTVQFQSVANAIINIFTSERNNWLCFAIFSFLLNDQNGVAPTPKDVRSAYQIARELSNGLQQLIQNAIQHTKSKFCVFTFYLDKKEHQLHLYVTDLNMRNTVIENFKQCLCDEAAICRDWQKKCEKHTELKSELNLNILVDLYDRLVHDDGLDLRHFFNVFAEYPAVQEADENRVKELWREFRQSDLTAHIGLLIFFQTIMRAEADFILQSTRSYDTSNRFVSTAEGRRTNSTNLVGLDETNFMGLNNNQKRVIPGTHYFIHVPTGHRRLIVPIGGASLSEIGRFTENYKAFAKYVDYKQTPLIIEDDAILSLTEATPYDLTLAVDKFQLQLMWTNFWCTLFSNLSCDTSKTVFVWSVQGIIEDYLSVADHTEIFLKGMFAALTDSSPICHPVYLAITNLNQAFFTCLKNVCISLSNRSFSSKVQLFFSDTECVQLVQLFGASMYEAVTNSVKLTIEHGSDLFGISDMSNVRHIAGMSCPVMSKGYVEVMPFDAIISATSSTKETLFDRYMYHMAQRKLGHIGENGYKIENSHVRLGNKVHIESFYEMSFLFYRTTIANRTAFQILRTYSGKLLENLNYSTFQMEPVLFYSYGSYSKAILTSIVEITRAYLEQQIRDFNMQYKIMTGKGKVDTAVKLAKAQIGFASYQHNLQSESTSDSVQLYFGISEDYSGGSITEEGNRKINLVKDIAVVQIVPISSTLATFGKMFSKLKKNVLESSMGILRLSANYTMMWVLDNEDINKRLDGDKITPSAIESSYWIEADLKNQSILVNDKVGLHELKECPTVFYSVQGGTRWNHPLFCRHCFPAENKLILEVPLVETDLTSTVPSMQIRQEVDFMQLHKISETTVDRFTYIEENNRRIKWLDGCVYYGHIKRGKNHYQYYINTQDFFYKDAVQREIESWLKKLREKFVSSAAKLKIIFSPEHNTNVGFAQYVNTFYFDGSAEIVSVNEDKVFRSNFICEHEMLRSTIERTYLEGDIFGDGRPIEFYFVDDTVNTGATIQKANSLLHSLLPQKYAESYPAFLFTKCFILVDRMSNASKCAYVESGKLEDFCSFLHIDISNMRVHGDSCVGCKLQRYAKRLFKRSSSRIAANYWAKKYRQLIPIEYDNIPEMENRKTESHAYERLVLSHIAQNYIFVDGITTRRTGEYYDRILSLVLQLLDYGSNTESGEKLHNPKSFYYTALVDDMFYAVHKERGLDATDPAKYQERKRLLVELLLKLLARPFFSFDYSFRLQLQSFLLILSESYLFHCVEHPEDKNDLEPEDWNLFTKKLRAIIPKNDPYKGFLLNEKRLEITVEIARKLLDVHGNSPINLSNFFKDVLFEALADMRSTYLLRRSVLLRVSQFVGKYLRKISCMSEKTCPCLLDSSQCGSKQMETCFWITYLAHVQRGIDCTSDEIKTIWLEYLILSGKELNSTKKEIPEDDFTKTGQCSLGIAKLFESSTPSVAEEMFLITTGVEFDLVEKTAKGTNKDGDFLYHYTQEARWHQWMGHRDDATEGIKAWYAQLSGSSSGTGDVPQTEKRYEAFLSNLRNFIADLSKVDGKIFSVALLTMLQKKEGATIENLQLVYSIFGEDTLSGQDIRRARYIVKDRVARAFNNEQDGARCVGVLRETGYRIILPDLVSEEEYQREQKEIVFEGHHVSGNHRKPYLVLLFDNPNTPEPSEELGRRLIPLSHVFLYISINIPDMKRRYILPRVVMRDILTYRNRIMRLLTEDFNGDLMEKNTESLQERIILTHERSASHASSTDDAGILRVFGLSNISAMHELTYPVDLESLEIIDQKDYDLEDRNKAAFSGYTRSADLWLLLQSYVNGQIARLFSRQFNSNDERLVKDEGVPALYLSAEDQQEDDIFKHRAKSFSDLQVIETSQGVKQDNRFALLSSAAHIWCYVSPDDKLFRRKNTGEYYNAEYIRCILLDVVFSSMKYATVNDSLLPRVDTLMYEKKSKPMRRKNSIPIASHIFMFRDGCFLVVLNNVKSNVLNRTPEDINEEIFRRTHDVLDYGDGHMSLFTIRKFVVGLWTEVENAPDVSFRYIQNKELIECYSAKEPIKKKCEIINQYDIWFETRLPIFEREE